MSGTDWRPTNRRSSKAKVHAEKHHKPKKTEKDLDSTIKEMFDEWKKKGPTQ